LCRDRDGTRLAEGERAHIDDVGSGSELVGLNCFGAGDGVLPLQMQFLIEDDAITCTLKMSPFLGAGNA
jgi:hypothetical protein